MRQTRTLTLSPDPSPDASPNPHQTLDPQLVCLADCPVAHDHSPHSSLADLHCGGNKNMLMSTPPRREQLLVHRLKSVEGTSYVWDVMRCKVDHTRAACERRACRGEGAGACARDV